MELIIVLGFIFLMIFGLSREIGIRYFKCKIRKKAGNMTKDELELYISQLFDGLRDKYSKNRAMEYELYLEEYLKKKRSA